MHNNITGILLQSLKTNSLKLDATHMSDLYTNGCVKVFLGWDQ